MCHTAGAPAPFPHLASRTPFTRAGIHTHTHTHTPAGDPGYPLKDPEKRSMDDDIWERFSEPAIHPMVELPHAVLAPPIIMPHF